MTNVGIDYNLVGYSEIDKYASKAYFEIHNVSEKYNLGDIKNIEISKIEDFDLMTWGFPCTDISIANRNNTKGIKGEKSSLYYYGLKFLKKRNLNIVL